MPADGSPLARQEALMSAHASHGYAARRVEGGDLSFEAVSAQIRALNRMYDAAMDCGMSHDEADIEAWATARVTRFLCEVA